MSWKPLDGCRACRWWGRLYGNMYLEDSLCRVSPSTIKKPPNEYCAQFIERYPGWRSNFDPTVFKKMKGMSAWTCSQCGAYQISKNTTTDFTCSGCGCVTIPRNKDEED
jgi:predicted RNA-binding Zn-ribbon protein involved in translation (DUF1610 family)